MAGFGWDYAFQDTTWDAVAEFLSSVDWRSETERYPLAVVESVLRSGADEVLAVTTSMHDLVVAPRPATDPPLDVIILCAPGSMRTHPRDTVRVDYQTVIGKHTEVVRPASEALPLFWRAVDTAFGVRPMHRPGVTIVHTRSGMLLTKDTYGDWREVQDSFEDYVASLGPYLDNELLEYLAIEYPTNPPFDLKLVSEFLRSNEQHIWSA